MLSKTEALVVLILLTLLRFPDKAQPVAIHRKSFSKTCLRVYIYTLNIYIFCF